MSASEVSGDSSPLVFLTFDPSQQRYTGEIETRAQQIHTFMAEQVAPYYQLPSSEGGLGLDYIDDEPYSVRDRVHLLRGSGEVQVTGKEYVLGFEAGVGHFATGNRDLKALLVLTKPEGLCTENRHKTTEIAEFDLAAEYRGQGLGHLLMQEVFKRIHDDDEVVLDVAAPNTRALHFYEGHGFRPDYFSPFLKHHGVYDVGHLSMRLSY